MTEIQKSTDTEARSGVVVIAIHGVGDPTPGSTGQAVARLLVSQAGYAHKGSDTWLVPVDVVHPNSSVAPSHDGLIKSLNPFSASPFTSARLNAKITADTDTQHQAGDLGIQMNFHLLRGTKLAEDEKIYTAHRHRLEKKDKKVDVVDLYWGDISGLENVITRIITELYVMVFHLCQIGRDAAQHTLIYMRSNNMGSLLGTSYAKSHLLADFFFTKPSGIFNALLVGLCMWWLPLFAVGQYGFSGHWSSIAFAMLGVILLATVGAAVYRRWDWRFILVAVLVMLLVIGFGLDLSKIGSPAYYQEFAMQRIGILWAIVIFGVYVVFLRFCNALIHGVLNCGLVLGGFTVAMMLWNALDQSDASASMQDVWLQALLRGIDVVMLGLLITWLCIVIAVIVAVLSGQWIQYKNKNDVVRGGVDTGRIGLFISAFLFIAISSAAWSVVIPKILKSFAHITYQPLVEFLYSKEQLFADTFVLGRFAQSTEMLSPVVLLLSLLLLGAVIVLLPSIAAEVKPPRMHSDGHLLGRWLSQLGTVYTRGMIVLFLFLSIFGVFWIVWATASFVNLYWPLPSGFPTLFKPIQSASASITNTIAILTAASTATVLALSSTVFGVVKNIRLGLDTALDVDRHFREFPDQSTPRGRVAARLKSILLAAQKANYERIVICAHSQGTVIVAELLRYMRERDSAFMDALPEIHLFTCGSPLRQLYAARFPALYEWLEKPLPEDTNTTGPHASMLGVKRWTNAYSTGDYVGRWLWIPPGFNLLELSGKNRWENGVHRQICLGKGAHTHYYDTHRATVATEIDQLIH